MREWKGKWKPLEYWGLDTDHHEDPFLPSVLTRGATRKEQKEIVARIQIFPKTECPTGMVLVEMDKYLK